jgi:hypothetical protein
MSKQHPSYLLLSHIYHQVVMLRPGFDLPAGSSQINMQRGLINIRAGKQVLTDFY